MAATPGNLLYHGHENLRLPSRLPLPVPFRDHVAGRRWPWWPSVFAGFRRDGSGSRQHWPGDTGRSRVRADAIQLHAAMVEAVYLQPGHASDRPSGHGRAHPQHVCHTGRDQFTALPQLIRISKAATNEQREAIGEGLAIAAQRCKRRLPAMYRSIDKAARQTFDPVLLKGLPSACAATRSRRATAKPRNGSSARVRCSIQRRRRSAGRLISLPTGGQTCAAGAFGADTGRIAPRR